VEDPAPRAPFHRRLAPKSAIPAAADEKPLLSDARYFPRFPQKKLALFTFHL
jgi:hypothetical protein